MGCWFVVSTSRRAWGVAKKLSAYGEVRVVDRITRIADDARGVVLVEAMDGATPLAIVAARKRAPNLPLLVVSIDKATSRALEEAFLAGAPVVMAPLSIAAIEAFVGRPSITPTRWSMVEERIDALVIAHRLTERQAAVLRVGVLGTHRHRDGVARSLGVTENTAKVHIRRLLQKFGERSFDALVARILREVIVGEITLDVAAE